MSLVSSAPPVSGEEAYLRRLAMATRPGMSSLAVSASASPPLQSIPLSATAPAFVPAPTAVPPQPISGEEAYLRRVALSQGIPYIPTATSQISPLAAAPAFPSPIPQAKSLDDDVPAPSPPRIAPSFVAPSFTPNIMGPSSEEIKAKRDAAAAIAARLGQLAAGAGASGSSISTTAPSASVPSATLSNDELYVFLSVIKSLLYLTQNDGVLCVMQSGQ